MNNETTFAAWVGIVLGAFGSLLALLDFLLILWDRRQCVRIERLLGGEIRFRVTNHTHRPIPIHSVEILTESPDQKPTSRRWPTLLHGVALPGVLNPESCLEVQWSTDDLLGVILSGSFRLIVESQTGRQFRSHRERILPTTGGTVRR